MSCLFTNHRSSKISSLMSGEEIDACANALYWLLSQRCHVRKFFWRVFSSPTIKGIPEIERRRTPVSDYSLCVLVFLYVWHIPEAQIRRNVLFVLIRFAFGVIDGVSDVVVIGFGQQSTSRSLTCSHVISQTTLKQSLMTRQVRLVIRVWTKSLHCSLVSKRNSKIVIKIILLLTNTEPLFLLTRASRSLFTENNTRRKSAS